MKEITLISTKSCPFCPIAKAIWEKLKKEYNFKFREVDAYSEEGVKLVKKFGINSVPATIVKDEKGERLAFIGVPNEEDARKEVM
jgi:thiol-disulfide isomerase/thioredoxin